MAGLVDLVQTLTSPHPLDRYLELVRPALTVRDLRAEVTRVRRSAPGSVTLTLRPPRRWAGHRAGQFIQIGVVIDGVKHTRCYSPIDPQSPRRRSLELTVKAHPGGLVSQYLYRHAAPGMVVDLAPAAGTFALPDPRPDALVLISGGSGITPVLSMLRTLDAEDYPGRLVFLHYAKSPEAVPHRGELDAIAERHSNFRIVLSYPSLGRAESAGGAPWSCDGPPPAGHFDYDAFERIAPWFAGAQTYVCGPASLMDAVRRVYEAEQLDDRLHTEEFTVVPGQKHAGNIRGGPAGNIGGEHAGNMGGGPAGNIGGSGAEGTTVFSASGVRADNAGASLLEQAESAGLTPVYGCRMGICLSCTSIKRLGCTRNLRTGELDSDPDQPIQLCINAAVGDVDIEI
ncbi:ferredoxin reductase [Nocardia terpenica]|uniref:ferredoxin reductase n=1 Tax=Nocardia terpenica TaxID=455432 RepID=UPI001894662D|nr:FAD-binding oxidoreductase [Nocardia terpenica]MBF6064769.1 ferredoxin reductase [Nocardia terpenica]MBF6107284.1 ferredoxin reductase [Nocardia terpenica]MBF6115041.1 ferredoxin reductase [Nocardia terpenica]MBF6122147.1 ferredoxin reductase [Nocardia terpenica]MBF6154530.1 ferredoxin reductase [Nocardia terpenica]